MATVQQYSNGVKRITINTQALTGIEESGYFESSVKVDVNIRPANTAYIFLPYSVNGDVGILNVRIYPDGNAAVYAYGRTLVKGEYIFTDGFWV